MNEEQAVKNLVEQLAPALSANPELIQSVSKNMEVAVKAENEFKQKLADRAAGKFDVEYQEKFVDIAKAIVAKEVDKAQAIYKTMNTGTGNVGGYLIFTEFAGEVQRLATAYGAYRRNATVMTFAGQSAADVMLGDVTVGTAAELAQKSSSDIAVSQFTIAMKAVYALVVMSNQLNDFSKVDLFNYILRNAAEQVAAYEDTIGFVGSATYTGGIFQNASNLVTYTAATGASTGALLKSTQILGALQVLDTSALANAKLYMSLSQFVGLLSEKDSNNNYIHPVAAGLATRTYFGIPVELTPALPAISSVTASTNAIILGDLRASCRLVQGAINRLDVATEATVGSVNLFEKNARAIRIENYRDVQSINVGRESGKGSIVIIKTSAT